MRGPVIEGGWVRIRRGRIVAIGQGSPSGESQLVDVPDGVILPGLVNAHTHLEFSDVRTPLDPAGGLPEWIGRVIAVRRRRAATEDGAERVDAAIAAGLQESAAAGVTAVGEIATAVPAAGYPAGGPRLRVFREALGLSTAAGEPALRATLRDVHRLLAVGCPAGLSPHAPYSVAARLGRALLAAGRQVRLPAAMHLAESVAEEELLASGGGAFRDLFEELGVWNRSDPPLLIPAAEWISLLARGPRGIVVHGTHLDRDPEALSRLTRHRDRLCVAVCPRTTRALSGVLPPVGLFRDAGLRIAIGTDSRASNPDLSVLAECSALVAANAASPEEAVRMATVNGAWALGFDRSCGILTPGRSADLVILRPATRHSDPFAAVVDPATRVTATLRGGRVIAGSLAG
jgi:cytosine/adenosine deaminase-related metal-dependent hydrolase